MLFTLLGESSLSIDTDQVATPTLLPGKSAETELVVTLIELKRKDRGRGWSLHLGEKKLC